MQYARGEGKNSARRDHLLRLNADVWVLTETHDDLDLSATHQPVHSMPRYSTPGGRWITLWSALRVLERLETSDPRRSVCVRLDGGEVGEVIVFGTVLPWNGDIGPDPARPARGWSEFHRVVPEQGREWMDLRRAHPAATLIVAGDLNHDLGGRHFYGTSAGRALLLATLRSAGLECLTSTDRFAEGLLEHPPIDHVCASLERGATVVADVHGWNNVIDGARLSDHGGTLVRLSLPGSS